MRERNTVFRASRKSKETSGVSNRLTVPRASFFGASLGTSGELTRLPH